jgi:hypothetical protein
MAFPFVCASRVSVQRVLIAVGGSTLLGKALIMTEKPALRNGKWRLRA